MQTSDERQHSATLAPMETTIDTSHLGLSSDERPSPRCGPTGSHRWHSHNKTPIKDCSTGAVSDANVEATLHRHESAPRLPGRCLGVTPGLSDEQAISHMGTA